MNLLKLAFTRLGFDMVSLLNSENIVEINKGYQLSFLVITVPTLSYQTNYALTVRVAGNHTRPISIVHSVTLTGDWSCRRQAPST